MIEKIISGGQTGADQGALDAAIKLGIPHGGWIPKGRKTENGPLPDKYQLIEMPTASYPKRTKKNIVESDGTLIVSHGRLTGSDASTKAYVDSLERPCLHIDLDATGHFQAGLNASDWIRENDIKLLNVAGPRAIEDPKIYQAVKNLIESVYHLCQVHESIPDMDKLPDIPPRTVNEAVDRLISELTLKDRTHIANMPEMELDELNRRLGDYIRNNFRLWTGNDTLMKSCRFVAGEADLHPERASQIIIDELWKRLKKTHRLRIVK